MKTEEKWKYYTKKQISSLVTKHVKLQLDNEIEEKKEKDEGVAYIMSLAQSAIITASSVVTNVSSSSTSAPASPAPPAGSAFKFILCCAKNACT